VPKGREDEIALKDMKYEHKIVKCRQKFVKLF